MCSEMKMCDATRAAWNARPEVTDAHELYELGMQAARTNDADLHLSDFELSLVIGNFAEAEANKRSGAGQHARPRR